MLGGTTPATCALLLGAAPELQAAPATSPAGAGELGEAVEASELGKGLKSQGNSGKLGVGYSQAAADSHPKLLSLSAQFLSLLWGCAEAEASVPNLSRCCSLAHWSGGLLAVSYAAGSCPSESFSQAVLQLMVPNITIGDTQFVTGDFTVKRLADDISVSLLTLVVTACGLALFGVSLFVSWKLCWVPWRERGLFSGSKDNNQEPLNYTDTETNEQENSEDFLDPPTPCPDSSMKISHTSPDLPLSTQPGGQENCAHAVRVQRQVTEPTPSARHNSIRRQLNLSNPDFNIQQLQRQEQLTGIGRIKPELYKQRSLDNDDGRRSNSKACGKLNFILKYDCDLEQLIVKIHKAVNLPAKDFSGTSDPYVKIYLLPDRKTKHQTKVHRKTLNPVFDEVFLFPVPYNDLEARKLHFSVYDFDRFSRHDLIGQVVVDHFFDLADFPRECILWKDIEYVTNDNVDLGELMFSLCYLPTAGRLTITIIKARNLKAMDITGASDPYVKVSLMCDGRRLKKRKTSTKRNTLNPVYNEAIVFDVPPESIDQIHLSIAVMDYDRVGHNEVIGVCQVGNEAERLGRDHWSEMLSYPRKPIAHWHSLMEKR
ncbi:synaptotagmin-9 [Peromyscus eremicus]|uniref:synaptotagmin-9 n=1 Tax=Peromyscus eremicus TaxID=42410 RepID=UPI0027DBA0BD|nr:synaptotagmin-9 [Peromyscus eremicus]